MSQSTPFHMVTIGTDGFPIIDTSIFDMIIDTYGFNVWIRQKPDEENKDCPCYDPYAKATNPDCPVCGGSGQTSGFIDRIVRGLILFKMPRGNWGIGDQFTMSGHLERIQGVGFFPGKVGIRMDDYILLNMASPVGAEGWFTFRIDSLIPRMVGDSRGNYIVIYNRADLRHVEFPTGGGL